MHDTGGHTSSSDTSSFSSHSSHSSHTSAGVSAGQYYPTQNPNDQFYPVQNPNDQFYPIQNSNGLNGYYNGATGERRTGPSPLVILLALSIILPIVFLVIGLSSFF